MLLVQEFLLTKSIGQLASEHGVYAHFDKTGTVASFSYDQIEARDDDPIAQECRGLILTNSKSLLTEAKEVNGRKNYDHIVMGQTKIIAFPFKRFFNLSQGAAANINFEDPSTRVQEKKDGTLIIVYHCQVAKEWHCATRGVPRADLPLDNFDNHTFRTLFEKAFKETLGRDFIDYANEEFNPELTLMFELTTPYNRIVCQYNDFRITLLGARALKTLQELDISSINRITGEPLFWPELPRVKTYSLKTPANIIKWVGDLNPLDEHGEGVVALDKDFNRVKIKNPKHGLLSRAKDKLGSSMRNCLELALSGKEDDFASVLPPEILARVLECKEGTRQLIQKTDADYATITASLPVEAVQKDFALAVQASKAWQTPMFKMRAGKSAGTREFIDSCKKDGEWSSSFLDTLLQLINKPTTIQPSI
jgi:hypothetical protein